MRQANQEDAHGKKAGRPSGQCDGCGDGAHGRRKQAAGGNGALERGPGKHHAERHDGLWAGAVVIRQPEGQEHQCCGPVGDPAAVDKLAKARQHLAGEDKPDDEPRNQARQAHEDRGGRNLGEYGNQVIVRSAKGRLRHAVPAVVIGHVGRVIEDAAHGEDEAIIGGIGAEDVPESQNGGDHAIERAYLLPRLGHEAEAAAIEAVDAPQAEQGHDHHGDAQPHGNGLEQRRGRGKAGVDIDVDIEAVVKQGLHVSLIVDFGIDAGDLRAQILLGGLFMLAHAHGGAIARSGNFNLGVLGELGYLFGVEGKQHLIQGHNGQALVIHADEKAAVGGLLGLRRDGAVDHGLALAQFIDCGDGDGGLQVLWGDGNERRVDGLHGIMLRPIIRGLGLGHRQ